MLSIAMIVKNEEKNIEESLNTISKLKSSMSIEIIVVDTGSTDKTVDIARKYTDKVFFHKWEDDFAKMRNISLSYCTGDWILVVDADEILDNPEEILKLFNNKSIESYNTATVKITNYATSLKENKSIVNIARLFRNSKDIKYMGIIHEQPTYKAPVLISDIKFSHNGYVKDDYELMEYKFKRNTKLLLKYIEENGDDIYTYFQLSQSYFVVQKIKESIFYIKKSINMIGNDNYLFKKHLYVFALYYKELYSLKDYEKCIEICKKVMKEDKNIIDTYYLLSCCYYYKKNYKEALKYGEIYLNIKENKSVSNISIEEFSLEREEDILEVIVTSFVQLKQYENAYGLLKSSHEYIKKDSLLEAYCTSLIMLNKIDTLKNLIKSNNNKNIYNYIINAINLKLIDSDINYKKEIVEKYLSIDKKVDLYINAIIMNETANIDESIVDFNSFNLWKAEIFVALIKVSDNYIKILEKLNYEDIREYLYFSINDYSCIESFVNYSKNKILTNDIRDLAMLDHIEEALINSNKVTGEEFKSLINRRLINKYNLMNKIYNKEILSIEIITSILSREEIFWYKLREILARKEGNIKNFVFELKEHIKEYKAYKEVYKIIQNEIVMPLSEEIQREKKSIIEVINELVNLGEIESAKAAIKELKSIAGNDSEIYNVEGVISYIEGDTYNALDKLLKGYIINDKNKDIIYNINEVLAQKSCM